MKFRISRLRSIIPEVASAASGLLLSFAFPPHGNASLAWCALAPFFAALQYTSPRRGFRCGFLAGFAFWLVSLRWFWALIGNGGPWPLVILGHFALSAYCALYVGLVGYLLSHSKDNWQRAWRGLARALLAAIFWTGLEWVRSTFLTGFAWNHLGVSQVRCLPLLQLAGIGGVYALTFLIVLVNAALGNVVVRLIRSFRCLPAPKHHVDLMAAILVLLVALAWGTREQRRWILLERTATPFAVAGVQPDAPSIFERGDAIQETLDRLGDRTAIVAQLSPDLVVWPETVLMGSIPGSPDALECAFAASRLCHAPLLAGAVEYRTGKGRHGRDLVANVSWLFCPDDKVHGMYRKQHLVPFGEFIPLDNVFPFLERLSPVGFSCTPGTNSVVLPITSPAFGAKACVSPLICFEDTVAPLATKAVRAGATLLVNQTNDSWFSGSIEPGQHHAQAAFRAVETRTPLVRVSNGGLSGIIAASGRQTAPSSYFRDNVYPRQSDWPASFYTRFGDWLLAMPCALVTGLLLAFRFPSLRKKIP